MSGEHGWGDVVSQGAEVDTNQGSRSHNAYDVRNRGE